MKKLNFVIYSLLFIFSHKVYAGCDKSIKVKIYINESKVSLDTIAHVDDQVNFEFTSTLRGYTFANGGMGTSDGIKDPVKQIDKTVMNIRHFVQKGDLADGITAVVFFDPSSTYNYKTTKQCTVTLAVAGKLAAKNKKNAADVEDNSGRPNFKTREDSGSSKSSTSTLGRRK